MDRVRQIEMVVRAAVAGSFAKAAASLNLTPSAVSHAIADLEKALRVTLFYRTTRQLKLTEDGEEFCRRGRDILDRLSELETVATQAPARASGTLRVGMGSMISQHVIMPRLPYFLQQHPHLFIDCRFLKHPKDMLAEGADLLLRGGEPPDSNLIARKIGQVRFAVYAAPAYLKRAGEPAHPRDLARHRCLIFQAPWMGKPPTHWEFQRRNERESAKVGSVLVSDEREGIIAAALSGGGIIRAGMFDPALIASGRLKRVLTDWTCLDAPTVYAMYRKTPRLPVKITAFIDFAMEALAAFDPEGLTMIHNSTERFSPRTR